MPTNKKRKDVKTPIIFYHIHASYRRQHCPRRWHYRLWYCRPQYYRPQYYQPRHYRPSYYRPWCYRPWYFLLSWSLQTVVLPTVVLPTVAFPTAVLPTVAFPTALLPTTVLTVSVWRGRITRQAPYTATSTTRIPKCVDHTHSYIHTSGTPLPCQQRERMHPHQTSANNILSVSTNNHMPGSPDPSMTGDTENSPNKSKQTETWRAPSPRTADN